MKIRELREKFVRKGVNYTQKEKNNEFVIYECKDEEHNNTYYEVFKYKLANPHPLDEGNYDKIEVYPSDNQFGVTGWCCSCKNSLKRVLKSHFNSDFDIDKIID